MPDALSFSILFGTSRESADLKSIAVNATRRGYAVIPVAPLSKKPLCTLTAIQRKRADREAANAAKEAGHRAWTSVRHDCGFYHAITDDKEADRVFKRLLGQHPDLNIALEVGRSRMLCVDADNLKDVEDFARLWAVESEEPALRFVKPTVSSPGVLKEIHPPQQGEEPDNPTEVWTHKDGGHWWFALPDDVDFSDAPTADPLTIGKAVVYFKDRVLLVPPSVREEGPYVLNSDIGTAPEWLIEAVRRHIDGTTERRKIQRAKVHQAGDPIDVWSVDTPWSELLERDGWSAAHKFDSCGCEIWSRPGDWSNYKSATAHEPGCTRWDNEQGHGFLHVWADEPPEWVRAYINSTGSRSMSKLQYVAWRDHDGKISSAMRELALGSTESQVDPRSLLAPETRHRSPGGAALDPKDLGVEDDPDVEAVTEEQLEGLRARMYTAARLETIPPPRWLIKGWLTQNSLARISGQPGAWKSFVALDMACCVATGIPYHGQKVTQGRVLYVAAEGVSGIRRRIQAWRLAHPHVEWVDDNMITLSGAVHAAVMTEWAELCAVNAEDQYSMIVLDTQSRITAGMDENSNTDMAMFVRQMDRLREQADSLVLDIHHTGHEGKRGRGASSIWGAMDIDMFLERKKEENTAVLSFIKSKDASEDATMMFTPTEHQLGTDEDGEPITSLTMHLAAEERGPSKGSDEWWIKVLDEAGLPNSAGFRRAKEVIDDLIANEDDQSKLGIGTERIRKLIKMRQERDESSGTDGDDGREDPDEKRTA